MKPETPSAPANTTLFAIQELLMQCGVTMNYKCGRQCAYAVYLAIQNPDRLNQLVKILYANTAHHFGTTWQSVERNMRTAAQIAWQNNPWLLSTLAKHPLEQKPKAAQFIAMLVFYFLEN